MNLYDILACPICKVAVAREGQSLVCSECQQRYPIVNGVPVLFPDGSVPEIQHEGELSIRTGYNPWYERIIMQSLLPSAIVLDLGAGNMAFNLPNVIRMDVTLTPYVDVVGDAHALPFLPGSLDFIFSLAVLEHLRQPFLAAEEMYATLRDGGYIYGECNFVYPYHGYPHHYFGMTQQGIQQVFKQFQELRCSVPTYQMPSFAVRFVLQTYRHLLGERGGNPEIELFREELQNILDQSLGTYDGRFTEEQALRLAAGVFFFGVKSPDGTTDVIPQLIQEAWRQSPALQPRIPNMLDLGVVENIMLWAKTEGRRQDQAIAGYLDTVTPFRKDEAVGDDDALALAALPIVEPAFGAITDTRRAPMLTEVIEQKNQHIAMLEALIQQIESGRFMRLMRRVSRA